MISIIIPVYNASNSLAKCLDSLLAQTVCDREIICVNDGSTDSSLSILRDYAEKHPEIIVIDKPNGGASSARNAGLDIAKGDYIAFLDSDDYYTHPSYLYDMLSCMQGSEDCDLVIAGYTVISDSAPSPVKAGENLSLPIAQFASEYWEHVSVINAPWNKLYKKAFIKERFNTEMTFGEDAVFVFNYLRNCSHVMLCGNVGYGYTCFNTSSTKNFREKQLYQAKQTNIYHASILAFWSDTLPSDIALTYYVKLHAGGIFNIMRKVLRIKGLRCFLKEDFGGLLNDGYLAEHEKSIIKQRASSLCFKFAVLLIKKKQLRLKLFLIFTLLKNKLFKKDQETEWETP